jgi:hypothetical protein
MSNVIAGVVTETRVSIELGEFSRNAELVDEVRDTCRSHQEDEIVRSSQFRALGAWMWAALPDDDRDLACELFAKILISRSLSSHVNCRHAAVTNRNRSRISSWAKLVALGTLQRERHNDENQHTLRTQSFSRSCFGQLGVRTSFLRSG